MSFHYRDLREFLVALKQKGELVEVHTPISPVLEATELARRSLTQQGPALLITQPAPPNGQPDFQAQLLVNLFGTLGRVGLGLGIDTDQPAETLKALRQIGVVLSQLKEPQPPRGIKDLGQLAKMLKSVWQMRPTYVKSAACQTQVFSGSEVDLGRLPIQTCWPEDAGPLITWGLVVTKGPHQPRQNLGIYRQQVIASNQVIMRWLSHRGGALDFLAHRRKHKATPFPIAVVLGADPATILGAVTPVPDSLSEYQFAGLLRGHATQLVACGHADLHVPASAEIILEGFIYPDESHPTGYAHAPEGPFGDHTGYYNEVEEFPVLTITRMTMRENPLYLSTYTGKPMDEPAVLGAAFNEIFIPLLQKQFSEILDFYLPPEGCSYRLALVRIKKSYPGHAKRVMMGVWSFLRQFMYTKLIVVVDEDIDIRQWSEVVWALTTRMDPVRDLTLIDNTPIDYLDFASPISGLGSKLGIDATNKWAGETQREWGRPIQMSPAVEQKIGRIWSDLGL